MFCRFNFPVSKDLIGFECLKNLDYFLSILK